MISKYFINRTAFAKIYTNPGKKFFVFKNLHTLH